MAIDVWDLDQEAPDWLEHIIISLLEVGVPPTALSRAFSRRPRRERTAIISVRAKIRYGGNLRGYEFLNVESIPRRSIHIGVCTLCDSDKVHYHVVIPPVNNPGQRVSPIPGADAE